MVEYKQDEINLSRRTQHISKDSTQESSEPVMADYDKKTDEDILVKPENENETCDSRQGLLGRLSGSVYNTTKYAAGTAYGGVTWVAGGVWSTTGTAIGATYNTVSSLSPVTIFRKQSKSKSD